MKGAEILCEGLVKEEVEVLFGIPGGAVLPFYDTLPGYKLRHILMRHEQGAAHAADGYARATGKVGVCIATSGPGASNLVTGIANAYLDSSPIVAITGQVPRSFIGKDAFQEIDITGITLPITKNNYLVLKADDLGRVLKEAFYLASTGRPGPVLIDIPRDVFLEETNIPYPDKVEIRGYRPVLEGHPAQIKRAARLINESKKPVIICGRGVLISGAFEELKELSEKAQIPVASTLLGIDSFPQDHFLSLGMLGMHGTPYANLAVGNSDLVIAVGMRFDDRATGRYSDFAPNAQIIHIDIDPAEIGKNVRANVPIVGDVKRVLRELNKYVEQKTRREWLEEIEEWRRRFPVRVEGDGLLPELVIERIYELTGGDCIVTTGVGQNQMWTALYFKFKKPRSLISSGGLGTMGFELPAAIGAKVGRPEEMVWCIAGDGGIQMTIQELAVIAQEKLDIKIAIIDNGYLGMVRQWQELFYGKRYVATRLLNPDFVKIAEAYGIEGMRVVRVQDVDEAIERAIYHRGPFLIDFMVEPEENVFPMVGPGSALVEMMLGKERILEW
ncbi:MAG: biosynthetic-type acetolactate synthase large subunit [Deltaproteobacteria bacterium]|nr:MAG: biosynthetic-type acetolactate synthase large subunit [Deltaproteobacteria bacterium]